jgi:hypothetical protein
MITFLFVLCAVYFRINSSYHMEARIACYEMVEAIILVWPACENNNDSNLNIISILPRRRVYFMGEFAGKMLISVRAWPDIGDKLTEYFMDHKTMAG